MNLNYLYRNEPALENVMDKAQTQKRGFYCQRKAAYSAAKSEAENYVGSGYDVRPGVAVSFGAEPDLVGLKGVHCELKRREHVNLPAALKQAATDAERFKDGVPCVFHRGNRENWRVTITLESWMELYKCYVNQSEGGDSF
ncbi:MAG: hypothetical protein HFG02_12795 [Oscillibacter sp.]|nr:hypothetical protein [Oscillibacter sp.]